MGKKVTTILGTGRPFGSKAGFTLMEVLLVLGLIIMVAGLFTLNFEVLITEFGNKEPLRVFHETVKEARIKVVERHAPVELSFDDDQKKFLLKDMETQEVVYERQVDGDVSVFIEPGALYKTRRSYFLRDWSMRGKTLSSILFYTDGTSSSALVSLLDGDNEVRLDVDSFSAGLFLRNS